MQILNLALTFISISGVFLETDQPNSKYASNQMVEICNDGIDNDQDGLIDCFDPDCCDFCPGFYYDPCQEDCTDTSPSDGIGFQLDWIYDSDWNNYSTPITGDIDSDGTIEIIGRKGVVDGISINYEGLLIVNGEDGSLQEYIPTPFIRHPVDGPAVADVDRDGYAEIFIQASNHISNSFPRHIYCYKSTGSGYALEWVSNEPVGYSAFHEGVILSVADFNGDLRPEVYALNQVFDSFTGMLMAQGGTNNHIGMITQNSMKGNSIAIDVLPDSYCSNCQGLELVCGTQVYAVNLDPVSLTGTINVVSDNINSFDGFTSIADMDMDGDLDGIVTTSIGNTSYVRIVDLQTDAQLYQPYTIGTTFSRISLATISDIDGNGIPEIIVTAESIISVLSIDSAGGEISNIWSLSANDPSGQSRTTTFDFDNNGTEEIIYRDGSELKVYDGLSGDVIYSSSCTSGTGWEVPTIVDIDLDDEAELLCSCGSQLRAYESSLEPWPYTRSVWNQHYYFNVNINDDLTVPPIQQLQQNIDGLNNMIVQYSSPFFSLPDLTLEFLDFECSLDGGVLQANVCNAGSEPLTDENVPISVYTVNPTAEIPDFIFSEEYGIDLDVGECTIIELTIDFENIQPTEVFGIISDEGAGIFPLTADQYPLTTLYECDYQNNAATITTELDPIALDLGPDSDFCENEFPVTLSATEGFLFYNWSNGDTTTQISAEVPGLYSVTVTNTCGTTFSDEVLLNGISLPGQLDNEIIICEGDSLPLSLPGYSTYSWLPQDILSCQICSNPVATPDTAIHIFVEALSPDGCLYYDSVSVEVIFEEPQFDTVGICESDTLFLTNLTITAPGDYEEVLQATDCEVTNFIHVFPLDTALTSISRTACAGDTITLGNQLITATGIYTYVWSSSNGCDSTVILDAFFISPVITNEEISLCPGDSVSVFGSFESAEGIYRDTFLASNGCDSIHEISLMHYDTAQISFSVAPACLGEPNGQIVLSIDEGALPYEVFVNQEQIFSDTIGGVLPGEYVVDVVDANGCLSTGLVEVPDFSLGALTLDISTVSCFGALDGAVSVSVFPELPLSFQLNGGPVQQEGGFSGLAAGEYELNIMAETGCEIDTTFVIAQPNALILELPPVIEVELGCDIDIPTQASYDRAVNFFWTPVEGLNCTDCEFPTAFVFEGTTYSVNMVDSAGCMADAQTTLIVTKPRKVYIPNAFSPNGDGVNDVFYIYGGKSVEQVDKLMIFDRWGGLLYEAYNFQASEMGLGWDGTFEGEIMNPGVFTYLAKVRFIDGVVETLTGGINLVK